MGITIDGAGTITGLDADGISSQPVFPGNVIQVVKSTLSTSVEGSSNFDIFNCQITPKAANSDILIMCYLQWSLTAFDNSDWGIRLSRDTDIILGESQNNYFISGGGTDASMRITTAGNDDYLVRYFSKQDIDNSRPSGTSQLAYKLSVFFGASNGGTTIRFQRDGWGGSGGESNRSNCTMVLAEIAK